ncbi:MAG: dipeptidase PepE [Acidobacteria bacterium]|nr:dipeptidase PepE [Acidobacteriota bacterium]
MRRLLLISSSMVHGYGYLDHCMSELKDFLGDARKILFVPFALRDQNGYAATVRQRLESETIAVDSLHQAANPARAVADAASIFVGGGNTFRLLDTLYRLDLVDVLHARVMAGVPYMGTSAGSNLACPTIMTTNDMPIVQPASFQSLDLVPFQLNPHYLDPDPESTHKGETRETRLREYHEMNDTTVIGLREGGILRIEGDRMILRGTAGARIFVKGRPPRETEPGADLSDLLHRPATA